MTRIDDALSEREGGEQVAIQPPSSSSAATESSSASKKRRLTTSDQDVIETILQCHHPNLKNSDPKFEEICELIRQEFEKFRPGRVTLCTDRVISSLLTDSNIPKAISRTVNKNKQPGQATMRIIKSVKQEQLIQEMTKQADQDLKEIQNEVTEITATSKELCAKLSSQQKATMAAIQKYSELAERIKVLEVKYSKDLPSTATKFDSLADQCDQHEQSIRDAASWYFNMPLVNELSLPFFWQSMPLSDSMAVVMSSHHISDEEPQIRRPQPSLDPIRMIDVDPLQTSSSALSAPVPTSSSPSVAPFCVPHPCNLTIPQQIENIMAYHQWKRQRVDHHASSS